MSTSGTTGSRTGSAIGRRRLRSGYLLALLLPALTALALTPLRDRVNLVSDMLLFLLMSVVAALVGGVGPALLSAVVGSVLINYFFTPPLRTLSVKDPNNALALAVFVAVAVLVSSAVDLAARRTREAARVAAEKEALTQVDRTRTALLAAVGHDLRTPLSAARASVATLRSVDIALDEADRADLLATSEDSLLQLTDLIDDLLDLSRLQAGALAVVLRPVGLDEVLGRALDALGPAGSDVGLDLPPDAPAVLVDAGLLERVLVNLLTNALHHGAGSSVSLEADLAPGADGLLGVHVVDHGPGIPEREHDQAYLPFQRLGDTDNGTGVGLGLALSRGLTEAMGGTLTPSTTPGGGLTSTVRLRPAPDDAGSPRPGLRERAEEDRT